MKIIISKILDKIRKKDATNLEENAFFTVCESSHPIISASDFMHVIAIHICMQQKIPVSLSTTDIPLVDVFEPGTKIKVITAFCLREDKDCYLAIPGTQQIQKCSNKSFDFKICDHIRIFLKPLNGLDCFYNSKEDSFKVIQEIIFENGKEKIVKKFLPPISLLQFFQQ